MSKSAKKAAALQADVKTDEAWTELLNQEGLTLVDIYCEWSGPCSAMITTLRNIKMEFGGDLVSFATARNDNITSLQRFRGKSEPVWMFIQDGKIVNMAFGAHCPNLKKVLVKEIKRVREKQPPKYELSDKDRTPDEDSRFLEQETRERMSNLRRMSKEEEEVRGKYEKYLEQMMIELSEETALIIFPWVFYNEYGYEIDKEKSPAYLDLVTKVLPDKFDVLEQMKVQLNEDKIEKMFLESEIIVTDDLIEALINGKCMAMRLKGRLPPADWPVPYPHVCYYEDSRQCPTRAINDVENFLNFILQARIKRQSFLERHKLIVDVHEQSEEDAQVMEYPAVWFPPNARSKVQVLKTLFPSYMDRAHHYEEPAKPLPLCAFKFNISKLPILAENYQQFHKAIEHFGIFEFDDPRSRRLASNPTDFLRNNYQNDGQVVLIIVKKINEDTFLAFAGNHPTFIEENEAEVGQIVQDYFPEGAVDFDPALQSIDEEEEDLYY